MTDPWVLWVYNYICDALLVALTWNVYSIR